MAWLENQLLAFSSKFVTERGLANRIRRVLRKEQMMEKNLLPARVAYHKAIAAQELHGFEHSLEHYEELVYHELDGLTQALKEDIEEDKKLLRDVNAILVELKTRKANLGSSPSAPFSITEEDAQKRLERLEGSHAFTAINGESIHTIAGLLALLKGEHGPAVFAHHVTEHTDNFAEWIYHSFGDTELSRCLGSIKERERYTDAIEAYIHLLMWHIAHKAIENVQKVVYEMLKAYTTHIDSAVQSVAGMESASIASSLQQLVDIPSQLRDAEYNALQARGDLRKWKTMFKLLGKEEALIGDMDREMHTVVSEHGMSAELDDVHQIQELLKKPVLEAATELFGHLGKSFAEIVQIYQQKLTSLVDLCEKDQRIDTLASLPALSEPVSAETLSKRINEGGLGLPDAKRYIEGLTLVITRYRKEMQEILTIERLQESAAQHVA